MDDQMQRQPVPVGFHCHRIDEERHVVVDDFDDRVPGLETVRCERRVHDANLRVAGDALPGKVPVRQRRTEEIGGLHFLEVFGIDLRVVARHERLQRRTQRDVDALGDEPCDLVADPCAHAVACRQKASVRGRRSDAERGRANAGERESTP